MQSCMTTADDQSHHRLKSSVMELLYRKDYSTESRPKLLSLGSLYLDGFSITKPSEIKMSRMLLGVHENVLQNSTSPLNVN